MNKNKQEKPKWFEGTIYKKGSEVTNTFSGETYKLNALELSIYDFIIGASLTLEKHFDIYGEIDKEGRMEALHRELYRGLDWFKKNNAKAYMILLD